MAGYVTMDVSNPSRPTLRLSGANLQVVDGLGSTPTVNGLGNVIVGYDEPRASGAAVCSDGIYLEQSRCTGNGGSWAVSHKSGSHNVVIGREHAYSQPGGLVAGFRNVINGAEASVVGGSDNIASGPDATVSGGGSNTASGLLASVSGGYFNTASGANASVGGGAGNTASGEDSTVSGGLNRTAIGFWNWTGGGLSQTN